MFQTKACRPIPTYLGNRLKKDNDSLSWYLVTDRVFRAIKKGFSNESKEQHKNLIEQKLFRV